MNKQIVHPISGGLDSLIATKILHAKGFAIHALYLDCGQDNNARSLLAAKKMADKYCVSLEIIKITSDMRENFIHIPKSFLDSGMKVMPKTGTLSALYAAMKAELDGIEYVSTGGMEGCTNRNGGMLYRLKTLLSLSRFGENLKVIMPFENSGYGNESWFAIAQKEGLSIDEMSETVSCYAITPCGVCRKCQRRQAEGIALN